ncbi:Predicted flavoprotein CzcO associated with the cation diffusion facilitator CzcD [Nonomuraea solani]|uniref:Predicted flavoprotein CzcO associated with the cation diffusion facilitator CzcD n=1 Tax=Nonomuraea solani TaxID=1144553 RepID=A0A1H5ZS24_9ACTN|nr:NAD(P)/FAD-dependent oxidoreductase [Nonomuraea solani]SEG38206.1 Predicted flavoprotein CzcO associated with the cation diffusion facilitator CzcD [Nonomuraea solani]
MAPHVAIIGAGFGGLCMAIQLERAGIGTYTVFEKADDLGGTWRDNSYPGAGCDIPSHLYSYSFEKYASWTRRYPGQPEILGYLEHCADKYGVRGKIRFGAEVRRAVFDESRWQVTSATEGGRERTEAFDVVVMSVGQLNRPRLPDIPGMAEFEGISFHSSRWNHDHDLTGRRVAVIGNGSSAAQFIPPVAERAEHLYVFQRTPNWVIPKPDATFAPLTRLALHFVPGLQRAYREWIYRYAEGTLYPALAQGWSVGLLRQRALRHLRDQVPDPELRAKLTPDYPPGCKRVVIDSMFYPALTRPNVDLVTDRIVRITPKGVETTDGLREVDTIVYATGFRSTEFLAPMEIAGRGGRSLEEQWKGGAAAYLGISMPNFPNLFLLYGPNTNLGHNSIIFMIECQVNHIMACLPYLSGPPMEVRPEAMAAWNRQLGAAMERMVWGEGCQSWYKTADGRVTNNWPGPTTLYRRLTARPPRPAYQVVEPG